MGGGEGIHLMESHLIVIIPSERMEQSSMTYKLFTIWETIIFDRGTYLR